MLERGVHLLAYELLPLGGLDARDEPIAHGKQHAYGDEQRETFDDLLARRDRGQNGAQDDGGEAARHEREHDSHPDRAQPLAMSGLEQERHDRADDEDGLESLAQNDEQTLKKRLRRAAGRTRELEDAPHVDVDRVARP